MYDASASAAGAELAETMDQLASAHLCGVDPGAEGTDPELWKPHPPSMLDDLEPFQGRRVSLAASKPLEACCFILAIIYSTLISASTPARAPSNRLSVVLLLMIPT
jgi:hypothetical protein